MATAAGPEFKTAHVDTGAGYYTADTPAPSKEEFDARWDLIWKGPDAPGWDQGHASAYLSKLLSSGGLDVRGRTIVVPGCGRGYDVALFAVHGAEPRGIEISPTACETARAHLASGLADQPEALARASVEEADFFVHAGAHQYDLGFDYTFFCAMHPMLRQQWAEAWSKAIKPGGELLTLIFPADPNRDKEQGPPFPIFPELARQYLDPFFEMTSEIQVPTDLSSEKRAGLEIMCRWRRR